MNIFKFGGASVKDASSVTNISEIIKNYSTNPLVVVVSAMGKMTNAFEGLINNWYNDLDYSGNIENIQNFHQNIINDLFESRIFKTQAIEYVEDYLLKAEQILHKSDKLNYDFTYDQIICFGELISTRIISVYLQSIDIPHKWIDARNFICTDNLFREGRVQWELTKSAIENKLPTYLKKGLVITQGFIGSDSLGQSVSLGREGSDYTASIFANCLNAESIVIWKDVPGIMNADPKKYPEAQLFSQLSYQDAIEMTFYGATVLHPKTIKPIQNKQIPLNVRSFIQPDQIGTIISSETVNNTSVPVIIKKENQVLITITTKDFSFIAEESIKKIFDLVVSCGINVNLMSNTAISFEICVDNMTQKIANFNSALTNDFNLSSKENVSIVTIKNYSNQLIESITFSEKVISEVKHNNIIQFIVESK